MSEKQKRFMFLCGQTTEVVNFPQIELYRELIREELINEFFPALDAWEEDPLDKDKIREVIDGAGDTLVVVSGALFSMGLNPEQVKGLIDISNLTKIHPDGAIKREDGKILKPDTYKPPVLDECVEMVYSKLTGEK